MINIRKRHAALALGTFEDLGGPNPSVLAFLRSYVGPGLDGEDGDDVHRETILCVHNLSRHPQPAPLHLSRFHGWTPIELTGATVFRTVGLRPDLSTLPGHGSYLFKMVPPTRRRAQGISR